MLGNGTGTTRGGRESRIGANSSVRGRALLLRWPVRLSRCGIVIALVVASCRRVPLGAGHFRLLLQRNHEEGKAARRKRDSHSAKKIRKDYGRKEQLGDWSYIPLCPSGLLQALVADYKRWSGSPKISLIATAPVCAITSMPAASLPCLFTPVAEAGGKLGPTHMLPRLPGHSHISPAELNPIDIGGVSDHEPLAGQ